MASYLRHGWFVTLWVVLLAGCGDDRGATGRAPRQTLTVSGRAPDAARDPVPPPDDEEQLVQAHHLLTVTGAPERARKILADVLGQYGARRSVRARAALALAELAELTGDRRGALVFLERAKSVGGPGSLVSLEADDRRARILTATPLADLRGPVPGSVVFRNESPQVVARFRAAEKLLAAFHRIVVAPQLEDVAPQLEKMSVLRTKRRAMAMAVAAYQKVAASATGPGRAAANFRMGAIHHHLAEALGFAIPTELLPSVARQLRRQQQVESASYLRKSLAFYRSAAQVPAGPGTAPWRQLAEREARTLALVLKLPRRRAR